MISKEETPGLGTALLAVLALLLCGCQTSPPVHVDHPSDPAPFLAEREERLLDDLLREAEDSHDLRLLGFALAERYADLEMPEEANFWWWAADFDYRVHYYANGDAHPPLAEEWNTTLNDEMRAHPAIEQLELEPADEVGPLERFLDWDAEYRSDLSYPRALQEHRQRARRSFEIDVLWYSRYPQAKSLATWAETADLDEIADFLTVSGDVTMEALTLGSRFYQQERLEEAVFWLWAFYLDFQTDLDGSGRDEPGGEGTAIAAIMVTAVVPVTQQAAKDPEVVERAIDALMAWDDRRWGEWGMFDTYPEERQNIRSQIQMATDAIRSADELSDEGIPDSPTPD